MNRALGIDWFAIRKTGSFNTLLIHTYLPFTPLVNTPFGTDCPVSHGLGQNGLTPSFLKSNNLLNVKGLRPRRMALGMQLYSCNQKVWLWNCFAWGKR
jgi:hypothetical protein